MLETFAPILAAAQARIAAVRPAAYARTRNALDGACPLCRREMGVYRILRPSTPVCFAGVSDPALPLPSGTTREQLMARFHVRGSDGQLLSGAQAFLALWAPLPGWRWPSRLNRPDAPR